MEKQTLHTEQLKTKSMTYFLDLKSSEKAGPYLVLTQSKKDREGNFQNNRVIIFSSDFKDFMESFDRIADQFKAHLPSETSS